MYLLKIIFSIFSNRYLLALVAFSIWILFFDENNYLVQRERKAELEALEQKIEYYQGQVKATKTELKELQLDPAKLERYAREKYFMKRDNEDVFVIDSGLISQNP